MLHGGGLRQGSSRIGCARWHRLRRGLLPHALRRETLLLGGQGLVLFRPRAAIPPAQARSACGVGIPSRCRLRHDRPFSF